MCSMFLHVRFLIRALAATPLLCFCRRSFPARPRPPRPFLRTTGVGQGGSPGVGFGMRAMCEVTLALVFAPAMRWVPAAPG